MASEADYRRVVTQVELTGKIRKEDADKAAALQKEQSPRGRAFRIAAGTNTSADSWGF